MTKWLRLKVLVEMVVGSEAARGNAAGQDICAQGRRFCGRRYPFWHDERFCAQERRFCSRRYPSEEELRFWAQKSAGEQNESDPFRKRAVNAKYGLIMWQCHIKMTILPHTLYEKELDLSFLRVEYVAEMEKVCGSATHIK